MPPTWTLLSHSHRCMRERVHARTHTTFYAHLAHGALAVDSDHIILHLELPRTLNWRPRALPRHGSLSHPFIRFFSQRHQSLSARFPLLIQEKAPSRLSLCVLSSLLVTPHIQAVRGLSFRYTITVLHCSEMKICFAHIPVSTFQDLDGRAGAVSKFPFMLDTKSEAWHSVSFRLIFLQWIIRLHVSSVGGQLGAKWEGKDQGFPHNLPSDLLFFF